MSLTGDMGFDALVNVPSRQVANLDRVTPFEPDASYLMFKVRGNAAEVGGRGTRMPLNRTPLSDAEMALLEAWIASGAMKKPE
jgi:hypothetical protein